MSDKPTVATQDDTAWRRTALLENAQEYALRSFETWRVFIEVLRSFGCAEPADYTLLEQWQRLRIELSTTAAAVDEVLKREALR